MMHWQPTCQAGDSTAAVLCVVYHQRHKARTLGRPAAYGFVTGAFLAANSAISARRQSAARGPTATRGICRSCLVMSLEGNSVLCVCVLAVCSVKAGGPDPVANSKLSDLLKQAKELGVPKDIIDRNIKKASDAKQGDFQECM